MLRFVLKVILIASIAFAAISAQAGPGKPGGPSPLDRRPKSTKGPAPLLCNEILGDFNPEARVIDLSFMGFHAPELSADYFSKVKKLKNGDRIRFADEQVFEVQNRTGRMAEGPNDRFHEFYLAGLNDWVLRLPYNAEYAAAHAKESTQAVKDVGMIPFVETHEALKALGFELLKVNRPSWEYVLIEDIPENAISFNEMISGKEQSLIYNPANHEMRDALISLIIRTYDVTSIPTNVPRSLMYFPDRKEFVLTDWNASDEIGLWDGVHASQGDGATPLSEETWAKDFLEYLDIVVHELDSADQQVQSQIASVLKMRILHELADRREKALKSANENREQIWADKAKLHQDRIDGTDLFDPPHQ